MQHTSSSILNILIILSLAAATLYATPGQLDPTFSGDGKVTTQIGGMTFDGNAVAVQSDGKIIVAGRVSTALGADFAVVRYNTDGSLDTSFGGDGLVTTIINNNAYPYAYATAVVVQTDGQIVVAGTYSNDLTAGDFALVRYNPDGSLDVSFDDDGIARTDINLRNDNANAMAIQPDGKIVVGGNARFRVGPFAFGGGGEIQQSDYAAVRYNSTGSLDTSFGGDGIVTADVGDYSDEATAVLIQGNGKIVLAGFSQGTGLMGEDVSLVRFDSNGAPDTTFDADGKVTTSFSPNEDRANSAAIQSNGKIVIAGYGYFVATGNTDIIAARYDPDGTLDTSFDGDGVVTTNILGSDAARAVQIQSDGKIIVAGDANASDFAVIRYQTNGALDMIWGNAGIATTDFGTLGDIAKAMAIQPDGKVVVAGSSSGSIAVARYFVGFRPGDLDPSFDLDGLAVTENFECYDSAIQPDGKIVVVGFGYFATPGFAVLRYLPNGSLDTTFDGDGIVVTSVGTISDVAKSVRLQPDGKIIAAGYTSLSGGSDFAMVRYHSDGSLDSTFGGDGIVTVSFLEYDIADEILVQPDGKIVVVGASAGFSSEGGSIARLNNDGSLDTTFDGDGKLFNFLATAYSAALQSDGKIISAGYQNSDFVVARYNINGSLDTSFDADGMVTTDIAGPNDYGEGVVLQPDGKIVVAGYQYGDPLARVIVVRYNQNGSLDNSFDGDGKVLMTYDVPGSLRIEAVAIQPNGKVLVGGLGNSFGFNEADFFITRFNVNGSLDSSWGNNGFVFTNFPGPPGTTATNDQIYSLSVQPNGLIVAAGFSHYRIGGNSIVGRAAVARYFGDALTPTASNVSVGGRVLDTCGLAVSNVRVTITDTSGGETQTALTNTFGHYRFEEIASGQTYILEAAHKRYQFSPRFVSVVDEITDADLIARRE